MHFYSEPLPEEVLTLLVEDDDPIIVQQEYPYDGFEIDKENLKQVINNLCIHGRIAIFVYEDKMAVVLRRHTAWVGLVDTKVSKKASAKDVIKGYKAFLEWAKNNTGYKKLETRTPLEKFAKVMAKACGAKIEGVLEKSYMTKEHEMIDEYIVGVVLCQ